MQEPAAFSGARPSRQDGPGRVAARAAGRGRARDGTGRARLLDAAVLPVLAYLRSKMSPPRAAQACPNNGWLPGARADGGS